MSLIPCPLRNNAAKIGQRPAIISGNVLLNYKELDRAVDFSALRLTNAGIKAGDRVCVVSLPDIEYLIALLAFWRIGAIACMLNQHNPKILINEQCKTVQAKILLTSCPGIINSTRIGIRKIELKDVVNWKIADKAVSAKKGLFYAPAQAATVIFSSGSSAEPKAAQHSLGNHYYNAKGANENIPLYPGDRWLLSLPLYHVSGLGILFRCLQGGAAIVIPKKNDNFCARIEKSRVTHISLVASQLYQLLSHKDSAKTFKKLKAILLGGSAIPEALLKEAIKAGLPIYASYGLTEMSSQVAATGLLGGDNFSLKAKILSYRKVSIASDGEILLSGETLFQGYLKDGVLLPAVDRQGWFHSGDIGYLEGGYLFVKGRRDTMFISGGENIFPEEIEGLFYKSGFIKEAVVVGFPSKEYGYRPVAFLKPKRNKRVSRRLLLGYLNQFLPKFKIPDDFYLLPDARPCAGIKFQRKNFMRLLEQGKEKQILLPIK